MGAGVERDTLGRAAVGVGAYVGPVPAVLNTQDVPHLQAGPRDGRTERVGDGGDELAGAVADDHDGGEVLVGQDGDRLAGDGLGQGAVGWVGQVEPERDVDPVPGPAGADDDQAVLGGEADQVRDDGEHGGRGIDTYWLVMVLCGHDGTTSTRSYGGKKRRGRTRWPAPGDRGQAVTPASTWASACSPAVRSFGWPLAAALRAALRAA